MMSQSDLFNAAEARKQRDEGMQRAAVNRADALARARRMALDLGRTYGAITADDVHAALEQQDRDALGNAAGSVFKSDAWEWRGEWRPSERVTNHGRYVRVWRYVDGRQNQPPSTTNQE